MSDFAPEPVLSSHREDPVAGYELEDSRKGKRFAPEDDTESSR